MGCWTVVVLLELVHPMAGAHVSDEMGGDMCMNESMHGGNMCHIMLSQ